MEHIKFDGLAVVMDGTTSPAWKIDKYFLLFAKKYSGDRDIFQFLYGTMPPVSSHTAPAEQ